MEERAARIEAEADAARRRSQMAHADALIALLQLQIEKLRREIYGARSEKTSRLIDQMELTLEDMTADAAEAEIKAVPGATPFCDRTGVDQQERKLYCAAISR